MSTSVESERAFSAIGFFTSKIRNRMGDKINVALVTTVLVPLEPLGSICQNEFLGGVQLIFDQPGVVIKTGFY